MTDLRNSFVFAKLDWFTVMLHDCSIKDVFSKLDIPCDFYSDVINQGFKRDNGLDMSYVFPFYGVSIEIKYDDFLNTSSDSLFDSKFKKIRLDISGTGLDYLRSFSVPDLTFSSFDFWSSFSSFNITRCDFAFDFINYKGSILTKIIDFIIWEEKYGYLKDRDSRLKLGMPGGMKYSYRCGSSQKTLYIGTGRSASLLRVYDKYLENIDENGIWNKADPRLDNIDVKTWIRFELQTRRDDTHKVLFGVNGDIKNVLRVIFEKFILRDEHNKPLGFLMEFYDWDSLPEIICISDFIQFEETIDIKVTNYIEGRSLINLCLYILLVGDRFKEKINARLLALQNPSSERDKARLNAFHHKLGLLCQITGKHIEELPGIDIDVYKKRHIIFIK